MAEGVLLLDADGRIAFASPDAEAILGCAAGQAAGQEPEGLLGANHPLLPLLRGIPGPGLHSVRLDADREIHLTRLALGRPSGAPSTLILLRTLPPGEAASLLAQAGEHGRLASHFAHEVRNPLNAMAIHLELLRRDLPADAAAARRSLEVLGRELGRIERLVRGLSDARSPAGCTSAR